MMTKSSTLQFCNLPMVDSLPLTTCVIPNFGALILHLDDTPVFFFLKETRHFIHLQPEAFLTYNTCNNFE